MLRLGLLGLVLVASLWVVTERLDWGDLAQALAGLRELSLWQVVAALAAVSLAFFAVAGQERAVVAWLGLHLPQGRAGRTAVAAAAVSQTLGFGPVVGALVRRRLLREVTLGQSFAISAGMTLGFFAGLGLLVLVSYALMPGVAQRGPALGLLGALLVGLGAVALFGRPGVAGLRQPNLFILVRFLCWLTVDLVALGLVLWLVLPAATAPPFWTLLPVFLLALGLGVASGSPGGVGPFEATLLAALAVDEAGLLAGIVAYRLLAFVLPAVCGVLFLLARPGRAVAGASDNAVASERRHWAPEALRALPSAEAQVIRQGALSLMALPGGVLWLSGRLAHTRVVLGPVMGPMTGSPARPGRRACLAEVARLARVEARVPFLYKIDAAMAVVARAGGWAVVPVAREAVLCPAGFHLGGPARARLRRKLAHARKAGITVEDCAEPPLTEMAAVAAEWQVAHGRERGFSMGRWERTYAAGQRVIIARNAKGRMIAFVTFHEGRENWVLDLVRLDPVAPDGTIYALITHALEMARWLEVPEVSLAAVPDPCFGLKGPLGRGMRRMTRGSVGLAQFKSAFAPRWRPLYAAAPSRLALVIGALEVARAVLWPAALPKGRGALVVLERGGQVADEAGDTAGERAA